MASTETTQNTNRPCWTCRQPATHTLTRTGSNTLHACDNCTRIDRTEAESRGWTITPIKRATDKESQMASNEPEMNWTTTYQDSGYVIVTVSGTVLHKPDPANPDFATKCGEHGRTYAWMGSASAHAICTKGC